MGQVEAVKTDEQGTGWGEFLRVRVKMDLSKPITRGRKLKIEGQTIWVKF